MFSNYFFVFSSRRRHTRCALVTGVQTCALPISAIELEPAPEEVGSGRYRITADPHDWLDRAGSGPALLHIDMDYFCNRFDGDTDWRTRPHSLDANLDIILSKIDEMAAALRQTGIGRRIEDVVIAYSPGFFPAEFWGPADAQLRPTLERLYDS